MRKPHAILAACLAAALPEAAAAQSTTTGSAGCSTLAQAAADAVSNRVAANDQNIPQPQSVKQLTCLDNFFKGTGLNVVANLLDPAQLINSIEGQLCQALTSAWQQKLGSQQCGITLTGFKIGSFNFGGLGGGLSCPKLTFGGGGPKLGYIGLAGSGSGTMYVNGRPLAPTGYTLPVTTGLW